MDPDEIKLLIEQGLEGSQVSVSGDGRHFQATVVAPQFEGLNMLAQHRAVYATLHQLGVHLDKDARRPSFIATHIRDAGLATMTQT